MRTLPPLNVFNLVGDEVLSPDPTDQRIVLVNTLASTALIHLRHPLLGRNEKATKQCLEAAENVVSTICSLQDHQYQFIDPIMGVSFAGHLYDWRSFTYRHPRAILGLLDDVCWRVPQGKFEIEVWDSDELESEPHFGGYRGAAC